MYEMGQNKEGLLLKKNPQKGNREIHEKQQNDTIKC